MDAEHAERTQHGYAIDSKRSRRANGSTRFTWKWNVPPPAAATTKSAALNSWPRAAAAEG